MAATHASHIGVEACIRRARDSLYWPWMTTELKEYIAKCDVCMAHRSEQSKEPIQQHEFATRPWSKVAADLCDLDKRTLLVISDYYSNYIEVARVASVTSRSITKELKAVFARFGIPDVLVTYNGPQFSSAEFSVFARTWDFDHVTSSPKYPQSNGNAENAVKTVKRLFKKCKDSGQSEFLALLDWRNTPTEGMGTSPAQRLLGRRCRTLLPIADSLLKPRYDTDTDNRALIGIKQCQQYYYNRAVKPLKTITPGETVRRDLYWNVRQEELYSKGGRHTTGVTADISGGQTNRLFQSRQKLARRCQHLPRTAWLNPPTLTVKLPPWIPTTQGLGAPIETRFGTRTM